MRASFSGLRAGGTAVRSTWGADRDSQPTSSKTKSPPQKRKLLLGFWWLLAESQLLFAPPTATPSPQWEAPLPALVCLRCSTPACQFWPVGVNKRGEARWVRRGFSPSRPPPRGEGGEGGWLTKKILPPQTPHRFKPMPHGLPCSLNPLPRELPRCAVVGAWFQPFFTYTNTYSGFPAAGCSNLGQQVPRGPQSLRVWVWGVAVPKQKLTDPSTLPEKDQFW